jgi:hypothetical protein
MLSCAFVDRRSKTIFTEVKNARRKRRSKASMAEINIAALTGKHAIFDITSSRI